MAQEMHWIAMGLWFSLMAMGLFSDPRQIYSYEFRSNLWNLDQALYEEGGPFAESKRRLLDLFFHGVLVEARLARLFR